MKMNRVKKVFSWVNRYNILINTLFMWVCVAFIGSSEAKWMRIFAVVAVFAYSLMLALLDGINSHIIDLQCEVIEIEEAKSSQYQELTEEYRKLSQQLPAKESKKLDGGDDESTQS